MVRLHPQIALGRGLVLEQGAVGVAANEARIQAGGEREGLLGQRAPREIAAGDDQVRLLTLQLGENCRERNRVPVDVRENRDPQ